MIKHERLGTVMKVLRPASDPLRDFECAMRDGVPSLVRNLKDNPVTQREVDNVTAEMLGAHEKRALTVEAKLEKLGIDIGELSDILRGQQ